MPSYSILSWTSQQYSWKQRRRSEDDTTRSNTQHSVLGCPKDRHTYWSLFCGLQAMASEAWSTDGEKEFTHRLPTLWSFLQHQLCQQKIKAPHTLQFRKKHLLGPFLWKQANESTGGGGFLPSRMPKAKLRSCCGKHERQGGCGGDGLSVWPPHALPPPPRSSRSPGEEEGCISQITKELNTKRRTCQ